MLPGRPISSTRLRPCGTWCCGPIAGAIPAEELNVTPSPLDAGSARVPSRFDIDMVIEGVRHHYGFEASDTAFETEWLYAFPRTHRRTLFERDGEAYHFGRGLGGPNKTIVGLTRPNSLYVSAAAQNGHEPLSKVYAWFRSIRGVRDTDLSSVAAASQLGEEDLDRRVIEFLTRAGTGVIGFRRKEAELSDEILSLRRDLHAAVRRFAKIASDSSPSLEEREVTFELAHRGADGGSVYFDLAQESAGTRPPVGCARAGVSCPRPRGAVVHRRARLEPAHTGL